MDCVAQQVAYEGLWEAILTFPKRHPYATNVGLSMVFFPLADLLVQSRSEKRQVDLERSALFCAYGFTMGHLNWLVYVPMFSRLCPGAIRFANQPWAQKLRDRTGQKHLATQVALDNFLYGPLVIFPTFYLLKWQVMEEPARSPVQASCCAFDAYCHNFLTDNAVSCLFWVPADVFAFTVPAWLRMPSIHFLSFVWMAILSCMRGDRQIEPCPLPGESAQGA